MSHCDLPPDIRGQWYYFVKILRQETPSSKPSFDQYRYSQYLTSIEQDNDFVILTAAATPPLRPEPGYNLGYWNKVYTATGFFWQLSIPDYDDNGMYFVTVSEVDCNGIPTKLSGSYIESGFNPPNPLQLPTVGGVTYTKINYK